MNLFTTTSLLLAILKLYHLIIISWWGVLFPIGIYLLLAVIVTLINNSGDIAKAWKDGWDEGKK